MNYSQVYERIEENREESIKLLQELVKFYPKGEEPLQEKIATLFEEISAGQIIRSPYKIWVV